MVACVELEHLLLDAVNVYIWLERLIKCFWLVGLNVLVGWIECFWPGGVWMDDFLTGVAFTLTDMTGSSILINSHHAVLDQKQKVS